MSTSFKNYYEILEIPPTASSFEIEQAYQKLATFWHPDKHKDNRRHAELKFQDINEAYEVLSNRNKRAHFDEMYKKEFSMEDAQKTFERFFEEEGMEDEEEKKFFDTHFPNKSRTYYDVLGVPKNSSFEDIKKAYRKLALRYHPKNNPDNKEAEQKFMEVNEAFNALSNVTRRQSYDDFVWGDMVPHRAHSIFEDFMGDRFFNFPLEEEFFKPILAKKWTRNLDRLMENDFDLPGVEDGETMKTSTVYTNKNGVESKKTVTTRKLIKDGKAETNTTEEYEYPNGTKEVRRIKDDGKGNVQTKVYNLKKGEALPIEN